MQIKIFPVQNYRVPYLYNKVIDVVRREKLQAQITPKKITLPSVTQEIIDEFKNLGINIRRVITKHKIGEDKWIEKK